MLTLSIIIPVYNVEKYLKQCVDSLCVSFIKMKYEMILIDDGSTDHSGAICDNYAEKYRNITVIHTKNAGASAARNIGIRRAGGTYLMFVDSDDYIAQPAFSRLEQEIQENVDLYFLQIHKVYPDGKVQLLDRMDNSYLRNRSKSYCMKYFASLSKFPGSACAKLIKRKLILEHHIFFEEGVTAEDLVWILKCMLYAKTFRYLDFPFYYYRQMRDNSVTSVVTVQSLVHLRHAIQQGAEFARRKEFRQYRREIYCMMAYEVEILLLLYGGLSGTKCKCMKCENMIKTVYWLMSYRSSKRTTEIKLLVRLIGVRRAAQFLYKVWKVKMFIAV